MSDTPKYNSADLVVWTRFFRDERIDDFHFPEAARNADAMMAERAKRIAVAEPASEPMRQTVQWQHWPNSVWLHGNTVFSEPFLPGLPSPELATGVQKNDLVDAGFTYIRNDMWRRAERNPIHYSAVPFIAMCGADVPNQTTTDMIDRVSCKRCKDGIDRIRSKAPDPVKARMLEALLEALSAIPDAWNVTRPKVSEAISAAEGK